MNIGLDDLLASEPAWILCVDCKVETMRERCWNCEAKLEEAQETRERLAMCRIPRRFAWASLDSPELQRRVIYRRPVADLAKRLMASRNAIVGGSTGMGKTSLAVACLLARAPRCMYVSADELSQFGDEKDALTRRALSVPLLLIDDLGTDSPNACNDIAHIVFSRHNSERDTWITTGLSVSQISQRYGEGFKRRAVDEVSRFMLGTSSQ